MTLYVNNFNYPGTQPKSGAVVLSDDLKNPAMEKLDLVRKWSINTYKVSFPFFDLFLSSRCPDAHYFLSVRESEFMKIYLSSAVHQADSVREVGSRLPHSGHGAGGSNRNPAGQQEKVPACNQAGSDAGRSAVPDDADAKAAG